MFPFEIYFTNLLPTYFSALLRSSLVFLQVSATISAEICVEY